MEPKNLTQKLKISKIGIKKPTFNRISKTAAIVTGVALMGVLGAMCADLHYEITEPTNTTYTTTSNYSSNLDKNYTNLFNEKNNYL